MADRSEYDAFVASAWHRLLRTAYLLTRDWAAAEDLVQAALLKAWLAWPRLGDAREAYVRKIIVNVHLSWWRRRWRQAELTSGSPPDQRQEADHMGQADERELVWQALGRLPARQRAVAAPRSSGRSRGSRCGAGRTARVAAGSPPSPASPPWRPWP
jgi:RNA polymerase sigma factor (sigma-70 family)